MTRLSALWGLLWLAAAAAPRSVGGTEEFVLHVVAPCYREYASIGVLVHAMLAQVGLLCSPECLWRLARVPCCRLLMA